MLAMTSPLSRILPSAHFTESKRLRWNKATPRRIRRRPKQWDFGSLCKPRLHAGSRHPLFPFHKGPASTATAFQCPRS